MGQERQFRDPDEMPEEVCKALHQLPEVDMLGRSHPFFQSFDYREWLWAQYLEHTPEHLDEYIDELEEEAADLERGLLKNSSAPRSGVKSRSHSVKQALVPGTFFPNLFSWNSHSNQENP